MPKACALLGCPPPPHTLTHTPNPPALAPQLHAVQAQCCRRPCIPHPRTIHTQGARCRPASQPHGGGRAGWRSHRAPRRARGGCCRRRPPRPASRAPRARTPGPRPFGATRRRPPRPTAGRHMCVCCGGGGLEGGGAGGGGQRREGGREGWRGGECRRMGCCLVCADRGAVVGVWGGVRALFALRSSSLAVRDLHPSALQAW